MKKTFGILFLILGIICLPGCFTGRTEQIIGHLLAATLIGFLPAFLLLRSSRKKKKMLLRMRTSNLSGKHSEKS